MVSVKVTRQRLALFLAAVAAVAAMTSAAISGGNVEKASSGGLEISRSASGSAEIVRFLSAYGWEVDETSAQTRDVQIPSPFDSVYEQYNALQRAQGFDLSPYRGRKVTVTSYGVLNYPGYEENGDAIKATVMVYKDKIIGGDIASVEFGGFMHGFDMETVEYEDNTETEGSG